MQISLEKKFAHLESTLSSKLKDLDLSELKMKSTKENLALVINRNTSSPTNLTHTKGPMKTLKFNFMNKTRS